ncbi:type VI immunity family protein [Pseudomonas sp. WSY_20]|uniref:type VI immunity family protein n=1 Tax=Pseudomonas sp. WSY_20 TaxID=3367212 RepID=UPI00370A6F0E
MSTLQRFIDEEDISGMVADLKAWPNTASGNDDFELAVSPFLTFYFTYDPKHYLETSLAMIDVHEASERLLGHPYTIATHPDSTRPHPYGSKRLGNLRAWAKKKPLDKHFTFNFTDEKNHNSSPTHAGYFWRTSKWGDSKSSYSSIQLYYRWQWWLDNKDAWRRFVLETIERLKPEQVYSGFAMANPLAFGCRSEVAVWDRALTPHFYGLDTDYPFSMSFPTHLGAGIRPPTWGFFLSDIWRSKLSLDREQVRAALDHPAIAITDCGNGQWIELGPQPELYPVENGVPELPVLLNRLLKPIRHRKLDLIGNGEWDGDPNVRFNWQSTQRWLARFDDNGDWPDTETRQQKPQPQSDVAPPPTYAGQPCPRAGYWFTLAQHGSRRSFEQGEVFPGIPNEASKGLILWQWADDQGNRQ